MIIDPQSCPKWQMSNGGEENNRNVFVYKDISDTQNKFVRPKV